MFRETVSALIALALFWFASVHEARAEGDFIHEYMSLCQGESCPGSGNTYFNSLFRGRTTNQTMGFVFADGTHACIWFKNGQAGSTPLVALAASGGVDNGILFVDNLENWVAFKHDRSHSGTQTCDHDGNFCIYASDCSSTLNHVYIKKVCGSGNVCEWQSNGGDLYTGPYQGHLNKSGEFCGTENGGCYPDKTGESGFPSSEISGNWLRMEWVDTLFDPKINPYAGGQSHFKDGLPVGVAHEPQ
jgi:hypothetical protein